MLAAFERAEFAAFILDLTIYEIVNVMVRRLKKTEKEVERATGALFDLRTVICRVDATLAADMARIAARTGLSGYDAAYVAAANALGLPLITADKRILAAAPASSTLSLAAL